jgi:hypothetical protein
VARFPVKRGDGFQLLRCFCLVSGNARLPVGQPAALLLLLFLLAAVLLFIGLRRAFASDRRRSKILGAIVTTLGVVVIAFFLFAFFVGGRQLPASAGAPQVGQRAPDFTLSDADGKTVSLNELLSTPINGTAPKGVLLVFYRGYW